MVVSTLLFFTYLWAFGFSITYLARVEDKAPFFEKQIMRGGIGMAGFVITGLLLNLVNIPLHWLLLLGISLIVPLYALIKRRGEIQVPRFVIKTNHIYLIIVVLFVALNFYTYASGAFAYPYLENDDSWGHTAAAKYISEQKTVDQSDGRLFQYMNPYPPSYDYVFGIIHQVTDEILWTMKFFNALMVSLGILLFYFFAKEFMGNSTKALIATLILGSVPAYLSHFIWAPVLAMFSLYPALYTLEKIKLGKEWMYVSAITLGGLLLSHPTHTVTLYGLVGIYVGIKWLTTRNMKYLFAYAGGIIVSFVWWAFNGIAFYRDILHTGFNVDVALEETTASGGGLLAKALSALSSLFPKWSGTASRPYEFSDFFVTQSANLINNPIGIGQVVFSLFLIGLTIVGPLKIQKLGSLRFALAGVSAISMLIVVLFISRIALHFIAIYALFILSLLLWNNLSKKHAWFTISVGWFLVSFLIINNLTFDIPYGFFAFRTWMIMVVPLSLIAAEGIWFMIRSIHSLPSDVNVKIGAVAVFCLLIGAGIYTTSWQQKSDVNTAQWGPGAFWASQADIIAHLWLDQNLPDNTKVFTFSSEDQVIGMNMRSCGWCEDEFIFRKAAFNQSTDYIYDWLMEHEYEYLMIGGREVRKFGEDDVSRTANELLSSRRATIAWQTQGSAILQLQSEQALSPN